MNKKEQLEYLEEALNGTIKQRLEVEVSLWGLKTMNLVGKDQGKMTANLSQLESAKENIDYKIKSYKKVIQRISDGEFII